MQTLNSLLTAQAARNRQRPVDNRDAVGNNKQLCYSDEGRKVFCSTCLLTKVRCHVASGLSDVMTTDAIMNSATTLIEESSLDAYIVETRQRIEIALKTYLPEVSDAPDNACPARLASAMRYSVLNGGKRLRAVLCVMAAGACGGDSEVAIPAACALEMVHSYSLIHDDLPAMDNDGLRRGRLTCHKAFDEATAILAGDSLLTLAFEVLAREIKPESIALRCVTILAEASGAGGMVGGQMADLQAVGRTGLESNEFNENIAVETTGTLQRLEAIHRRKTGALLRAPLQMGATIVGASEQCLNALYQYGSAIGLAFQIVDDLLDVQGVESTLGKRVGKDSDLGKWTYPKFLGIDASHCRARELALEASLSIDLLGERGDNLRRLALALVERDR
jgi:geranylgeranyl diphosphate synthase type II